MTSGQINCLAPLPEGPADARLAKLLVPAPYVVPENKAKKKATGTRKSVGAWRCRFHHPTTPRRTPPVKTRRRKKRPLPLQRGEERRGRPPLVGEAEGSKKRKTPPPDYADEDV